MQIALWGLRGGVGTTSVTAMLADVLSTAGDSVLLIDMNPDDMLRLHFGLPYGDERGWARAGLTPFWRQQTYQINEHLSILPYGRHRSGDICHYELAMTGDMFWAGYRNVLTAMYDWVLYDVPASTEHYSLLRQASDLNIMVAHVDMASHILLEQSVLLPATRILVNCLDPAHRLSNDILLVWRQQHGHYLLPGIVHLDQNVQEAFAHKAPVTTYKTASSGAHDMIGVARWCQALRREAA